MNKLSDNIWTVDGDTVPFFGLPYSTRMTVIRLSNGKLWLHSPSRMFPQLITELDQLGEIKYLVSPNKLHHLFLSDWIEQYPQALCYGSPGLAAKRKDIHFEGVLGMTAEPQWADDIDQTVFKGSSIMEEVVFFHKSSRTLLFADLIENFNVEAFNWWQASLARFAGIVAPDGRTPIDWRMSFMLNKEAARKSLQTLMSWQPECLVISHGECVYSDAHIFLKKSFAWLLKPN